MGDRMKRYEGVSSYSLPRRIPVILRVDGRAFHTVVKKQFGKTWSCIFVTYMQEVALALCKEIQGCAFCYCQSDEISFLLTDYKTIQTDPWFDYDVSKMVSISASTAAVTFSRRLDQVVSFDSRAFSIPQDDVVNYFLWRQRDAVRNAIQMAAREYYSHKELHKKSFSDLNELFLNYSMESSTVYSQNNGNPTGQTI